MTAALFGLLLAVALLSCLALVALSAWAMIEEGGRLRVRLRAGAVLSVAALGGSLAAGGLLSLVAP